MSDIAVLGAGAFGTALAISLAKKGAVTLWARNPSQAENMRRLRENDRYLPGVSLAENVAVSAELETVSAKNLLLCVPAQLLGGFLSENAPTLQNRTLILCSKGIDRETGLRGSQLVERHVPDAKVAVLTGPSFAVDIARGLPTALTLATHGDGTELQQTLSTPNLRPYLTDDVVGAELGGALKNVIALAAGLTIGAGLADSARAAVITRGFAEMSRYAVARGARAETLAGLSGLGDLTLTCGSEKSRNFTAGLTLARGETLPEGQTIEGVATALILAQDAKSQGIDLPLTQTVAAVCEGRLTVDEAAAELMQRPLRKE